MSQENVEVVVRVIEAWNRNDLTGFLDGCDEHLIEWYPVFERRLEGSAAVYHGRDGLLKAWNVYREAWEEVRVEPLDLRDLGERVLMLGRLRGHGKGSGIPLDVPVAMLFTLRDGKIIRSDDYANHRQGLEAAGLRE